MVYWWGRKEWENLDGLCLEVNQFNSLPLLYVEVSMGENLEQGTLTHRRATQHWIFYYFFSINVVFTWMEEMRFNALPLFGAICIWLQCYSESRI